MRFCLEITLKLAKRCGPMGSQRDMKGRVQERERESKVRRRNWVKQGQGTHEKLLPTTLRANEVKTTMNGRGKTQGWIQIGRSMLLRESCKGRVRAGKTFTTKQEEKWTL